MLGLVKLIWELFVLRDQASKGQLTARVWLVGIGFVGLVYGVGLPVSLLYGKDHAYKPLFIAVLVLIALCAVGVTYLGFKWKRESEKSLQDRQGPDGLET